MDVRELRIGSLVQGEPLKIHRYNVSSEGIHKLTGEGIRQIGLGNWKPDPIPLTEEWLKKFGFKKYSDVWDFWENSMWSLKQHKNKNAYWLQSCMEKVDCTRINYVHQLQNLYFALTNTELTIKK